MPDLSPTNSLERALKLLEIVAQRPEGYTNSELSRKLEIPTSSCSYILTRLARDGYLSRGSDGRYTIGLKTLILAHAALRKVGFRPIAEPVLHRLVEETGLAANMGMLEGGWVLLVDRVESPASVTGVPPLPRELRDVGMQFPAHTTGLGKVLLAALDRREVDQIIRKCGLARKTPKTIVQPADLFAELDATREQGFARVRDEHYTGFWSIAVPVRDAGGVTRAAISLTGNPGEPAWHDSERLVELLHQGAREISKSMRLR